MGSNSVSIKVIISKATRVSSGAVYLPMSGGAMAPRYTPETNMNQFDRDKAHTRDLEMSPAERARIDRDKAHTRDLEQSYQPGYSGPRY